MATVKLDTRNVINSKDLAKLINLQINTLKDHPEMAATLPPLMLWGAPGVGKSTVIRECAKEAGIGFIDVRLAQREPVDIRGLPVPGEDGVKWLVSSEWPRDPNSRGIILFDEITAADRSLQVAAYEFILDRRLGNLYSVPDGWYIMAAGNRAEDRAVATSMSSALANRFMHVEVDANAEDWLDWAQVSNIHPSVTGFIRYKPAQLFNMDDENLERGWPSPRAWERVSQMCHVYNDHDSLLQKIVYGLVGNRAGVEFMAFHKLNAEFDNVLDIMLNPKAKVVIPNTADRKWALVSALTYLLWRGKDANDETARIDGFYRIVMELPADFATTAMTAAMQGADKKMTAQCCMKLFKHKSFKTWKDKFGENFKKRINF